MAGTTNADGTYDVSSPLSGVGDLLGAVLGKETDRTQSSEQTTTGKTSQTGSQNTTGSSSSNTGTTGTNTSTGKTVATGSNTGSSSLTGKDTTAATGSSTTTGTTDIASVLDKLSSFLKAGGSSSQTNQNTAGSTSSQESSSSQSNTRSQTSGTTDTTGSQRTTGSIGTTGTQTTTGTSRTTMDADIAGLRDVYAEQAKGVTPEMLAAIFTEGAKAAPQLITSQSNAMGARGVGNTAVARVLNNLNAALTEKAANLNRQMLTERANTAAAIAANTRNTTTTNSQETASASQQLQDLLTQSSSTSVMKQLQDAITNTVGQKSVSGTSNSATSGTSSTDMFEQGSTMDRSTGSQTQQNTQQQNTASNTNTDRTQASTSQQDTSNTSVTDQVQNLLQNVINNTTNNSNVNTQSDTAQEQVAKGTQVENVATTINSGALKNLVGSAAAGVGLIELYKIAKNGGFGGTVQQLANWMKGSGMSFPEATAQQVEDAILGQLPMDDGTLSGILDAGGIELPDLSASDFDWLGFADGGQVGGFEVPDLFKKPAAEENKDKDLEALLASISAGTGSSSSAPAVSTGSDGLGTSAISGAVSSNPSGFVESVLGSAVNGMLGYSGVLGLLGNALGITSPGKGLIAAMTEQSQANAIADAVTNGTPADDGTTEGINAAIGELGGLEGLGLGEDGIGFANGGKVVGPGTGTSDSIPVAGTNIRVSNGEYIIPADVVAKFGASAFDELVAAHHVPAAVQRAVTGEK